MMITSEGNATIVENGVQPSSVDPSLDIMSMLRAQAPTESALKPKTALEKAKEAQQQKGLIVSNKELEEKNKVKAPGNKSIMDGMSEADSYAAEQDNMIKTASQIALTQPVKTAEQMVKLIDELDNVAKTGQVSEDSEFIRNKTEEELAQGDRHAASDFKIDKPTGTVQDGQTADTDEGESDHRKIVDILIDRTGYGDGKVEFTDEEREKMVNASMIRVKEVEEVDLASITVRRPDKSFLEETQEHQFARSIAPIAFPASRFTAKMAGLSYGEMGDISFDPEKATFEQVRKRLTVIYNKMRNPSCGKFESFDDFLKKFSYTDIDFALFALAVATFPELDDINMRCNNSACMKNFNHQFQPRTLISYEYMSDKVLSVYRELNDATPERLNEMVNESPTRNIRRFKLPESGFVVSIGIASAYDYLYTVAPNVLGDKFKDNHPDDVNGVLNLNSALLNLIRSVLVPNGDGTYTEYDDFEDMIQALYMIKPREIMVLANILQKYYSAYTVVFTLRNVKCPHCGQVTPVVPVNIGTVLFQVYGRLMNTEVELDNISVL